ncbi:cytochrome c oxidase subunit 3 [Anaplasmataceae bacterium AB001_6]|nr:cytochrome c oxidase subunit 3 [Anaplasmataceae bacterium AB001_6]
MHIAQYIISWGLILIMLEKKVEHKFHIIDPSYKPIFTSFSLFLLVISFVLFMREKNFLTIFAFLASLSILLFSLFLWWKDIILEAIRDKAHNEVVQKGLKIGMILFIITEIVFFGSYFASFFTAWINTYIIEDFWNIIVSSWPPEGIKTVDPLEIPFINTCILLLSGCSVSWAHYALLNKDNTNLVNALFITIMLGLIFIFLQFFEFAHSDFNFVEEGIKSLYTSNFYMLTGFHGAHVIIGVIFLTVCLIRAIKGQLTPLNHLGFEFASWYWHFVDVVWIFVFLFVYVFSR